MNAKLILIGMMLIGFTTGCSTPSPTTAYPITEFVDPVTEVVPNVR